MKLKNGLEIPEFGMGAWKLGDNPENEKDEIDSIKSGLDMGIKLIDTAEMYGDGASERLIGKAIKGYNRKDLYIVSKVCPFNAGKNQIFKSLENSLARLETNYLDLYLIHWKGNVPLAETVECMEKLVQMGKIKSWGVSNFDVDDMKELLRIPNGENCVVNQLMYHLGSRGIEYELKPLLDKHNIKIMAYCPLAHGGETRKRLIENEIVKKIARKYNATELQILIAFLLNKDVIVIPGSKNIKHIEENYKARNINISSTDMEILQNEFPAPNHKVELDML